MYDYGYGYGYESSYQIASPGAYGVGVNKPRKVDPSKEYTGGGPNWTQPGELRSLPDRCYNMIRPIGPETWRAMLTDASVSSSYRSLQLSILADGPTLTSPVKAPAWYRKGVDSSNPDQKLSPKQKLAEEILAYCERLPARLGNEFREADRQQLDCMGFGVKLTEVTTERLTSGVDAGKEVWKSLKVKPDWAWRFVVDAFMNVKGILTWDVQQRKPEVIDVSTGKYIWHSWMPQDADPRGTSILEAAYFAWNLKIQSWPLYYQHLVRFGSPGLDMVLAPNDIELRPDFDSTGNDVPNGDLLEPAHYARKALSLFRGGGTIVRPNGSELNMFEPKSQGEAFLSAMDLFDRQICLAISLQARMGSEAKNGGKADGLFAQDLRGVAVMSGRDFKAEKHRDALKQNVALNWGRDVAEELTPVVSYGATEAQDKASLWASVAVLQSSGFATPSMKEQICSDVGLPSPDMAADDEAAKAKALSDAEALAASRPPPPKPGDPATPGGRPVGVPRGNSGKGDNKS